MIQAYYLVEAGYSVKIIEKRDRWGGLIGSVQKGDFFFEHAANAMMANRELERVAEKVGVALVSTKRAARRRYIFSNGQMKRWPVSFAESLPFLSFLLQRKWKSARHAPLPDESMRDWGIRSFGVGLTDYLLSPALQGVYATSSDQLSASLILDSLNNRPRKGQLRGSVSPQGGMQEWLDKMGHYLQEQGVEFCFNAPMTTFDFRQPTVLAMGLQSLKEAVVTEQIPMPASLSDTRCASLTSVSLGFSAEEHKLSEGFGCLFPKPEKFHALGVLFNHSIFPGRVAAGASETWILNDEKIAFSRMSSAALLRYVRSDRSLLSSSWTEPDAMSVAQWPQSIAVYDAALAQFIMDYQKQKWPFLLMGHYLGDLGLAKLLFHAQANVEKIKGGYFG